MPGTHKGQRRVSKSLELELLRVVSCHGNQIRVFWEGVSAPNYCPFSPAPRTPQAREDMCSPDGNMDGRRWSRASRDWCKSQPLLRATAAAEAGGMHMKNMFRLQSKFKASLGDFVK